jgi:polyphenol oxidase
VRLTFGSAELGFTNRRGGVSRGRYASLNLADHVGDDPVSVAENRRRLAVGFGVTRLMFMRARHSAAVAVIDDPAAAPPAVDAMVTATPGIALVALAADCVPVLLVDPVAAVIGVAHAGRRGVAADVVGAAVEAMTTLGAVPDRTIARLGPAICPNCYEVGADVFAETVAVAPAAAGVSAAGGPALDLRAALTERLRDAGVECASVGGCTRESPDLFSYRRDRVTGRFAGVAMLRSVGND